MHIHGIHDLQHMCDLRLLNSRWSNPIANLSICCMERSMPSSILRKWLSVRFLKYHYELTGRIKLWKARINLHESNPKISYAAGKSAGMWLALLQNNKYRRLTKKHMWLSHLNQINIVSSYWWVLHREQCPSPLSTSAPRLFFAPARRTSRPNPADKAPDGSTTSSVSAASSPPTESKRKSHRISNLERIRTKEQTNGRQTKRKSHTISNLGRNRTEEQTNLT
jgi:hypothetical protein